MGDVIKPHDRPGHRPKPAAENTDRAQLAKLGADSATRATVKDCLTVDGWPGHRPLCRGPGSTKARRLRRAGMLVRGRR